MNRRQFIQTAALAAAGTTLSAAAVSGADTSNSVSGHPIRVRISDVGSTEASKAVNWPIGCFNRPWLGPKNSWSYDTALDGIKGAGYKITGLLTRPGPKEPLIGSDATPEYLAELKKKIAAHDLKCVMGALRTKSDLPLDKQIEDMRKQIDNGKTVGVEYLLTFGVDKPKDFESYYKLMQDAAPYAQERGLKLVLKPHGGASGASEEILRCMDKVKHPNFKIWFDAGNIIYYTGKDPVEQLKPIADKVTGFCAKDCGGEKSDVFIQFGTGKVDFHAVFAVLKDAGFHGPVMVECCQLGDTPEIVTSNAAKNREYLEKVFATL